MPRWAFVLLSLVAGAALGFGAGFIWPRTAPAPAEGRAPLETARTLHIQQGMYRESAQGDPLGHLLRFSGVVSGTLLVTHEIREQDREQLPLMTGEVLHRSGFFFAGLSDELVFVRQGSMLQIQRQIEVENETPEEVPEALPFEVIATYDIGEGTKIEFE